MTASRPIEQPVAASPRRLGPRPLPLHLTMAMGGWTSALGALPLAINGLVPWAPDLDRRAEALTEELKAAPPAQLLAALADEIAARHDALLAGLAAYWAHPYRRALDEPPVLWRRGAVRLLDYGARGHAGKKVPALFVPSLVNRAYILDLAPERSLLRYLAARAVRPWLVDWGAPGAEERGFGLGHYITERLVPALDAAVASAGRPVALVGYCMGGLLAVALAQRCPDKISALALLATPWDFQAEAAGLARAVAMAAAQLDGVLSALGEMPVDLLQAFFAMVNPAAVASKFCAFAALEADSAEARDFVQVEDWLNDGVPLAAGVARECLIGWYGENRPARGCWMVADAPVRPAELSLPVLLVTPSRDRIVPRRSAEALAAAIPDARVLSPDAGHIGMVVGRRAKRALWAPLQSWLLENG